VQDLSQGERRDDALWQKVGELIKTGGSSAQKTGAVRGARSGDAVGPQRRFPFSWREIPIDTEGDVCVENGARLTLWRSAALLAGRITVVDTAGATRAEVRFAAGVNTAPWPAEITPKVGAFTFLVPERPTRQIRLRLIQPLPAADETLRLLNSQRCLMQLDAWLRGTAIASQ